MKLLRREFFSTIFAICLVQGASAGTPAQDAFAKLKNTLAGNWQGKDSAGNTMAAEGKVVGKGSVLQQKEMDMINMYHLDGDSILLTHYCEAGNQPRMRAKVTGDLDRLQFDFVDVTNADPKVGGFINQVVIEFISQDQVRETWSYLDPKTGKSLPEVFNLERVK